MAEDELGKAMQLEDMRLRQEAQMKNELAFDDVSHRRMTAKLMAMKMMKKMKIV